MGEPTSTRFELGNGTMGEAASLRFVSAGSCVYPGSRRAWGLAEGEGIVSHATHTATSPPRPRRLPASETPRACMLAAAEQLVSDHGAEQLTATAVTAAARVSATTFCATFADREDCLLALFDEVVDRLRAAMLAARAAEGSWLDGVRAALLELLAFLDSEPHLARFLVVGGVCGDPALVVRRRRVLAELAGSLDLDSPDLASRGPSAPFGSQVLVNGAASIIHARLLEDPAPALVDMSGSLMAFLVWPFVGEGLARRELTRPSAAARQSHGPPQYGAHPSSLAPGRVTDRMACVLTVIADAPGISNRVVAHRAGNVDEGQISKLLTRLARLGLIENRGKGQRNGAAKAWHLTARGARIERTVRLG